MAAQMLHIIPDKCTGCMQCELACSWVQTGTFQPSQSLIRVSVFDEQASYAPLACIQCDDRKCKVAMHPSCALATGMYLRYTADGLLCLCREHEPEPLVDVPRRLEDLGMRAGNLKEPSPLFTELLEQ